MFPQLRQLCVSHRTIPKSSTRTLGPTRGFHPRQDRVEFLCHANVAFYCITDLFQHYVCSQIFKHNGHPRKSRFQQHCVGPLTHTCRPQGGLRFVYTLRVRSKRLKTQELPETQGMGGPLQSLRRAKDPFCRKTHLGTKSQNFFAYDFGKVQGSMS